MQLDFYQSARFYISVMVNLQQAVGEKESQHSFRTPATDLLSSTDINEEVYRHIEILGQKIDQFVRNGMFLAY